MGKGIVMFKYGILVVLLAFGAMISPVDAEQSNTVTVTIKRGETLYRLAKKYETTVEKLISLNKISDPRRIQAGQLLQIPKQHVSKQQPVLSTADQNVFTFSRGRVLGDFTLTAYTSGFESTGKTPKDPAYGITASGAPVQDGVTIAVDPNVIPIGSRIYIEGIGYRIAQDVGRAIKGNRIDVYISDLNAAKSFGVQKGKRVEIID